jgi:hypothetical protein
MRKRVLVQDLIKVLCAKLLETRDEDESRVIANLLQVAIHEHIEQLRLKVLSNMGKPAETLSELSKAS